MNGRRLVQKFTFIFELVPPLRIKKTERDSTCSNFCRGCYVTVLQFISILFPSSQGQGHNCLSRNFVFSNVFVIRLCYFLTTAFFSIEYSLAVSVFITSILKK